ncbi:unnamed protein product [Wuchereria bancrofti]|uniref:Uncharacterized protein n=1 Tax=Wuchereria bancrofti TaxID=6293 RepID=A0A3P7DP27_WUCBA|nr:unnamed protein product [Wuchereria bancrofti]
MAINNCNWISGIPFDIPEKWNCEVVNKNATLHKLDVHTRTHIRIPAIKHYTNSMYQSFSQTPLSLVSDHAVTTATSSQFSKYLNVRKQMNGIALISIF